MRLNLRGGGTLPEMLVALVLTSVAGIVGTGLLVTAERRVRGGESASRQAQLARDLAHVLGPEIAGASPGSVAVRGDTALDLDALVGLSVACAVAGNAVVLPGDRTSGLAAFSAWRQPPERDDVILAWDSGAGAWSRMTVTAVASRPDGGGCPAGSAFRTAADSVARVPVLRASVAPTPPPSVGPGTPVRVVRAVRWVAYRAADRAWWLGYRRCPAGACGAVQPVAGPIAPPADSGLRFAVPGPGLVAVTARPLAIPAPGVITRTWAVRGAAP